MASESIRRVRKSRSVPLRLVKNSSGSSNRPEWHFQPIPGDAHWKRHALAAGPNAKFHADLLVDAAKAYGIKATVRSDAIASTVRINLTPIAKPLAMKRVAKLLDEPNRRRASLPALEPRLLAAYDAVVGLHRQAASTYRRHGMPDGTKWPVTAIFNRNQNGTIVTVKYRWTDVGFPRGRPRDWNSRDVLGENLLRGENET